MNDPRNSGAQSDLDQGQSFVSHLLELRDRLLRAVLSVLVIFVGLIYFARDIYTLLTNPQPGIDTSSFRATRERAGLSLQAVADTLGTWPTTISRIERGLAPPHAIVPAYRDWLTALPIAA